MKNRIYLLIIGLLFLSGGSMAQNYTLQRLGMEDGLSNNYVVDITQDKQGCIWVATESGLNRFDGNLFTVYKKNNSKICSNELNTLLYNKEDNTIWIGSQRDGLSVFDCATQQFRNDPFQKQIISSDITQLLPASDGGIWITHYHLGVDHYNPKTQKLTAYSDKEISGMKGPNWCSTDDGNGNLFIGHAFDGLSIIDLKKRTARNFVHDPQNPKSLPGNEVRYIHIDHLKNIWIGTNGGLALFNPHKQEFITFRHNPANPNSLISNNVFCIKEMKDETLWVCADMGGISILDLQNTTFMDPATAQFRNITVTNDNHGLSSANPRCLFQDFFGNIWIGNYRGGLDFISNTQPTFQTLPYAIERYGKQSDKQVWGICLDNQQQVWVGGENETAVFHGNKPVETINISPYSSKQHTHINLIRRDKKGMLWFGLYNDGVLKLNPQNKKVERIRFNADEDVRAFYEDDNGKMWIGTETGIRSYFDDETNTENDINNQLPDQMVHSILRDRQGKLWVGSFGQGLCVFDRNDKRIHHFVVNNGFCSNAINHLFMDTQGGIWAATRNGLAYFKNSSLPAEYEIYADKEGLEDTHVRAIQEDKDANIWISTNSGISRWHKQKYRFSNYNHHDGTPLGDFMDGSACIADDGTIYFGSQNGVCYFTPRQLTEEHKVTPVQIIECKGFNQQTEGREEEYFISATNERIELPYDHNSFSISFTVPDYSQSQQAEYSYMMEGLESAWYSVAGEKQVTFRNLPPGYYTFKVKARLRNQEWDEAHISTMNIRIEPPLWLTWYAKLLYVTLFCFALYALLRFYKRRLDLESSLELEKKKGQNEQDLNNERLRFYTNITHELRTPLTLILGPLEDLLHDGNLPSFYRRKINIIHGSAVRLLNLINQILDFRKAETQNHKLTISRSDLASLVTEIGLRYKELNQNDKLAICIHIETAETQLYFDISVMTTILNNLLSNAVKYTPEGEIKLVLRSISEEDIRYAEIEVSDTGYGIEMEALPHIFDRYYQADGKHQASGSGIGLALVKSLANLHEGLLHVESTPGKGTAFTFRLLMENNYPNSLHKEDKAKEEKLVKEEKEEEERADKRPIVLVVEDNDDIREYICSSFSEDYRMLSAGNGEEGLALAKSHIPNVIVSDIMMPIMDGIELCRAVKEDICTSHIPVILLTAKDSIQDKEEGYESGADSYLTKPFSAKLLNSRIHNLLEMRKRLARQIQHSEVPVSAKNNAGTETAKLSKLDNEFLEKVTQVVKENIDMEKMDVAFIADKMSMSHSTLYRKTKGLTDMSINEFVRKIKIRHSAHLLSEEGYNVSEAAFMTGFYNRGYFRQCFKEEFGVTPSDYVKQIKGDDAVEEEDLP